MVLSEMAQRIFKDLYCFSEETIDDAIKRVAKEFSNNDVKIAYDLLKENKWRPNSPVWFSAGTDHKIFSACFVCGLIDSMDGIYDIANVARKIFQNGAGIGIPIGNLREKDALIYEGRKNNIKNGDEPMPVGRSSGPLSFMHLYDAVGATTKSGGRARRAAIMISMPVWHPDILDFIKCKEIDGKLSNMNISVAITDKFMQAFKDNVPFTLISPSDGSEINEINARTLWDAIIDMAWKTADPGIMFIDTVNKYNALKKLYLIETSNPCGEQFLQPFASCQLSSINIHKFCKEKIFDFEGLYKTAYNVAVLMDSLIDKMEFPDPRFKEMAIKYRPFGVGFMGVADTLFELDIPYDSHEGRILISECMKTITTACVEASSDIAKEKGTFSDYEIVKDDIEEIVTEHTGNNERVMEKVKKYGLRNSQFTTVAPTGCLVSDTLISSNKGIKKIVDYDEILKNGSDRISTISDFGKNHLKAYYNQGIANTIKITSKRGYDIEGTFEHKLRVLSDGNGYLWKTLNKIYIDDIILLKKNFIIDKSTWLSDNKAEFLGLYMADGWWDKGLNGKGRLYISFNDKDKDYIINLIDNSFGKQFTFNTFIRQDNETYGKIDISSKKMYDWFIEYDCIKEGAQNAFIPQIILDGSKQTLLSFIKGYWKGDGHVRSDDGRIGFKTISNKLAHQLHTILLGLGYPSNLSYTKKTSTDVKFINGREIHQNYDTYSISLNKEYSELLLKEFGYNIETTLKYPREYVPILPHEEIYFPEKVNISKINTNYCVTLKRYKEVIDELKYNWFVENELYLDFVSNKEFFEQKEVHDLEIVENTHTYVANGFITHNTTALSADCSYGIEPSFGLVFTKTLSESGDKYFIVNSIFKKKFENESWYTPDLIEKIEQNKGSLKGIRGIPKEVRDVFITAHDIKFKDRIDMQAGVQKYTSNAISSTLNLPSTTTRDEVSELYRYAYQKGLKGVTIYRDGSKKSQPITFTKDKTQVQSNFVRPSVLKANVHTLETGNGKLYITISTYNGKPIEIFMSMGKSGQLFNVFTEALGRSISIALQHGVPIKSIIKTLIGINSDRPTWARFEDNDRKPTQILSIPDGIAKLLQRYYTSDVILDELDISEKQLCSKCGTYSVILTEGCKICYNCGLSECN